MSKTENIFGEMSLNDSIEKIEKTVQTPPPDVNEHIQFLQLKIRMMERQLSKLKHLRQTLQLQRDDDLKDPIQFRLLSDSLTSTPLKKPK